MLNSLMAGHLYEGPNGQNRPKRTTDFNENFLEIIQNVKVNQTSCFEQVHDAGVQDKTVI